MCTMRPPDRQPGTMAPTSSQTSHLRRQLLLVLAGMLSAILLQFFAPSCSTTLLSCWSSCTRVHQIQIPVSMCVRGLVYAIYMEQGAVPPSSKARICCGRRQPEAATRLQIRPRVFVSSVLGAVSVGCHPNRTMSTRHCPPLQRRKKRVDISWCPRSVDKATVSASISRFICRQRWPRSGRLRLATG